ncbi:MAG: hypothetical protein ACLF0G_12140 [Candidatus Brocadiia bacterium]
MAKSTTDGTCFLCRQTFSGSGMSRHVAVCLEKHPPPDAHPSRRTPVFHLRIQGQYLPEYWLHLEAPARATLADVDRFLRNLWLECCGHMSAFYIEGQSYSACPMDDLFDQDMDVALGEALAPKTRFTYEYDFGSTTHLAGRVVGAREAPDRPEPVRLVARNDPPDIPCGLCGRPAEVICPFCSYEPEGWMCKACAAKHGHPEPEPEVLLPVVNSPRAGVCAYAGGRRGGAREP